MDYQNYQVHVDILMNSIEKNDASIWNSAFKYRHLSPILKKIHLNSNTDIHIELVGYKFGSAVLQTGHFVNISFIKCSFEHSDLDQAYIKNCKFIDTTIKESTFRGAIIENCEFTTSDRNNRAIVKNNNFTLAIIRNSKFRNADCKESNFSCQMLENIDFQDAILKKSIFSEAKLKGVIFDSADISQAIFKNCKIEDSSFLGSIIEGTLFWKCTRLIAAYGNEQKNLVIRRNPALTLDSIETAQFISMIEQERLDEIINEVTSKVVLIIGSFSDGHKLTLDLIREHLKTLDWVPVIFDFRIPYTRDVTETITLLARISKFIIADLTDAKSVQQEIAAIAPHIAVPIAPIVHGNKKVFSMFRDYWKYEWILSEFRYDNVDHLIANFENQIMAKAIRKAESLNNRKQKAWQTTMD